VTSSSADLRDLISRGETDHVEFKAANARPSDLARNVAAMANVGGGQLIVGVDESGNGAVQMHGVDAHATEVALRSALMLLRPAPPTRLEIQEINGVGIALIEVEPAVGGPVLVQGLALVRVGARTVPASADQLMQMVSPHSTQAALLLHVQQFSVAIEAQSKIIQELRDGGGWKNKLLWAIIGAFIGLLVSIPTLLFQ
jgi:predicted HTH transcriptional regulator